MGKPIEPSPEDKKIIISYLKKGGSDGKIISARLATDDYDPMNLLGTTEVFSPTKYRLKNK